jgi:hypothetical protein
MIFYSHLSPPGVESLLVVIKIQQDEKREIGNTQIWKVQRPNV